MYLHTVCSFVHSLVLQSNYIQYSTVHLDYVYTFFGVFYHLPTGLCDVLIFQFSTYLFYLKLFTIRHQKRLNAIHKIRKMLKIDVAMCAFRVRAHISVYLCVYAFCCKTRLNLVTSTITTVNESTIVCQFTFSSSHSVCVCFWPKFSDRIRVQMIYEKLSCLYNRIIKSHENINNVLESIRIWGHVPLYQRRESNATSLLDIDDRLMKFKSRCIEVNNSKKLIEYTMEENYRLLFDLPLLERKKEFGKDRLRNTIMRKFGRHQAKDKIERSPSVVS